MPEAMLASGRVRSFESMWTRKHGFPFPVSVVSSPPGQAQQVQLFQVIIRLYYTELFCSESPAISDPVPPCVGCLL